MIDETDVSVEKKWLYERRAAMVIKNLQKGNMNGQYVSTRQEALSTILEMIPPGALVVRGDSISMDQIGAIPELIKRNQNAVVDPFIRKEDGSFAASEEERWQMQRQAFYADVFLTGTNAITLDGKLVNIDGFGNRVSATIFGPRKVIIAVGANKIVRDADEAVARIKNIAAPMNVRRHYLKHNRPELANMPCLQVGTCVDCNHERRICRYTVIIEGTMIQHKGRINVVLVGEELGL